MLADLLCSANNHLTHCLQNSWQWVWLIVCRIAGNESDSLFASTQTTLTHYLQLHIDVTYLTHCGMAHSYMWHGSFICVAWPIHSWDMIHSYVSHYTIICVQMPIILQMNVLIWRIHTCDMTHSCAWHDSFICVTWLIHTCDMTHSYAWHDSFICVKWLIHTCDMTHPYVWHDPFIRGTWPIHMCDMTHSYVWHDSFICVTWLIHMGDMPHAYVWHDSLICVTWPMHMCGMTHSFVCRCHSYVWHDSFTCVTRLMHMFDEGSDESTSQKLVQTYYSTTECVRLRFLSLQNDETPPTSSETRNNRSVGFECFGVSAKFQEEEMI